MNVQDYLKYSTKITPDGKFHMIETDGKGWEGALSQGRDLEEAGMMAKAVIYDCIEGLVEFKKKEFLNLRSLMTEAVILSISVMIRL